MTSWILQEKEGRGLRIHEVKNIWGIWQHVWQALGPLCHLLLSDAGEAQRLCWLLCSFPHSSSPYGFIFFSVHLKIWPFLLRPRAAETTMLSWGENLYLSRNKPLAPELPAPLEPTGVNRHLKQEQDKWNHTWLLKITDWNQWLKLPIVLISNFLKWQHCE